MGYTKPSYAKTDVDNNFTNQTINNNVKVLTSGSSGDLVTLESTAISVDFRLNSDDLILKFDDTEILKFSEFSTSGQGSIENLSFVDFASKFQISTSSGTALDNLTSFLNIRQRVNGGVFNLTGNTSGGTQHTGVQICSDATNVDVLLNYNGVEKLATKSDGVEITGNTTVSGLSSLNGGVSVSSTVQIDNQGILVLGSGKKVTADEVFGKLHMNNTSNVAPSSSTDTGTKGEIRYTSDYIYVCIATDTWKRTPLTTW